jgi:hypothetical protein
MALETRPAPVCEHYTTDSTSVLNDMLGAIMQHLLLFSLLIQTEVTSGDPNFVPIRLNSSS